MIGIGIIGCGKISQIRHIPEYLDNPEARIVACCDNNQERAAEIAARLGAKAYSSVDELLSDPEVSAVSVCVANNAHCEVTVKALKAGKDVLCEKPMATTIEDCELMVRTARECGRKLMIGQNQRLAEAHAKARELIAAGTIGKVLSFRTSFGHSGPESWSVDPGRNTWFFDRKVAVMGVMADLGIHKTDLIQYILGQRIVATSARLVTIDKTGPDGELIGVDDNAICVYEMNGGAIGTMTASWTYYGAEDNSTVIYGTEGNMTIYDIDRAPIVIRKKGGEVIEVQSGQIQTNDNQTKSGIIDAFIDCLVEDREPTISGQDVLAAMRAVFASIRSSEEGIRVEIPENR
ncbi:MAG: Gfo/Idh/MocA family oxidoreductase [Bacteroidales bacterium]|nr:Gfo/Idh/MocA family oxidoreductase [Candidatus Cryptobacteroides faecihippi]